MPWQLHRDSNVLTVRISPPYDHRWPELFEAILRELESGAAVVVLPGGLPNASPTVQTVLGALADQIRATGVQVQKP